MFSKEVGYEAVRTIASQEDLEESTPFSDQDEKTDTESTYSRRPKKYAIGRIWPWMSLEVNTLLLGTAIWQYSCLLALRSPLPPYPDLVYSPAQHLIEYEQVEFVDGLRFLDGKPRSIYLGPPTDESDAAWNELYDIGGINQIPASEAAKLLEPTAKVLDEPGYHFVGLDVFHQLHCLNWVRKMLRPERYGWSMDGLTEEQKAERFIHHDHCIDSIRQSLMCSADVSPVIWHWKKEGFKQDMNNTHVCRNFEKIKGWAKEHMLEREINSNLPEDKLWDIVAEASSH